MKITLAYLEKHLFPERYPCYKNHFAECTNYLKQIEGTDKSMLNVSFIVKLSKLSMSIENENHKILCNILFEKIVEHYYDWNKEYNWQDLKLFLMYFIFFSKAKSIKEIKHLFSNATTLSILKKYQPVYNG